MERLFRYIVVISTLLFAIIYILPFYDYLWLNDEQLYLAAFDAWGSVIPNNIYVYWSLFFIWLAISVGLFFFIPIARTAFVIMLVATTIASLFWGFLVLPPISATLFNIVAMSDGAILVMLYLTSVSRRFEYTPNK